MPAAIRGPRAALHFARFLADPLGTVHRLYKRHGPLVSLGDFLPIPAARITVFLAIGARFNSEVLRNPSVWRPTAISPGGPSGTAARRLVRGLISMTGREHEHYRRLLSAPMQRRNVEDLAEKMAATAVEEVERWPHGAPASLSAHVRQLILRLAIGLMFGDEREHGVPIANMINRHYEENWPTRLALCPVDAPGTPFRRMLRNAEALEQAILDWASAKKRNAADPRDLLSVLATSADENGDPICDAKIVGHTPTLFGAAYETCQDTLMWTLLLLEQHPQVARDLYDELQGRLQGSAPTLERIGDLPLLDRVVKESMRVLPPVPQQFRRATEDTTLDGFAVRRRSYVLLSPFLTNRNPDLYPDGDRFKPERWESIAPSPFEYSAFSAGPRACIGYWFGMAMLKTAIASILPRRRMALAAGTRIDYKLRVAFSPRRPVQAMFHRQDGAFTSAPIKGGIRELVRLPT